MNRRLWYIKSAEIFSWLAEEKVQDMEELKNFFARISIGKARN